MLQVQDFLFFFLFFFEILQTQILLSAALPL